MPSRVLDVAVVGGGVSGAYTAWRLKEQRPELDVALFEYSDRIGGRLLTKTLPGLPHVHAELGGMRYIPQSHALVANLVDLLGLPTVEFLMGDPRPPKDDPNGKPVGADKNLYYLRQKPIRARDLTRPGEIPYNVGWMERGLDPDQLQDRALEYLVPNHASLKPDDWFKVKVFGRELYKFGFWNLLYRVLSNEAYEFMRAAGGYDANVANSNAVAQFPTGEYGPDMQYRTLRDGYQRLPEALVRRFEDASGPDATHMKHRLLEIAREDDHYRLHFRRTERKEGVFELAEVPTTRICDLGPEQDVEHLARQVILAMPRRSLELIEWDGWKDPDVRKMRESVMGQAAFKLFLGYEAPWWRALDLYAGRSITDLPIRQVYYFGTECEQPGGEPGNCSSLLMASYNDISSVPFWKGTENDEPFVGYKTRHTRRDKPVPIGHAPVTKGMVELAENQLREMHGQVTLPAPYTAVFHEWTDDPYGGGWHEWKAGVEYNKVIPAIRQPVRSEEVYICGEAYSSAQGWVEGALRSAEKLLEGHFGLKRPGWLPDGYDMGW